VSIGCAHVDFVHWHYPTVADVAQHSTCVQIPFFPMMPGAVMAEYNNLEAAAKVGGGPAVEV
jgi:hypothetical protein